MTSAAGLAVAAAAWAGALSPQADAWRVAVAAAFAAAVLGRRAPAADRGRAGLTVAVAVAAAATTSTLSHRAWAGLEPPAPARWSGPVVLVADPEPAQHGLRILARAGGRRVEAWVAPPLDRALAPRMAGEVVWIDGRLAPLPPEQRGRLAPRHVSARMSVDSVGDHGSGRPVDRLANAVKRTMVRGAARLPPRERELFSGVVVGDDRHQDPGQVADFRAAGLSHLTAVSGQNVALVLAVAAVALRRLGLASRMVASLALIALFGTLTRWEPSVLRAAAMAASAVVCTTLAGRRPAPIAVLAWVVAALVAVDPLLVHSLGFQLSVAATAGIAAASAWMAARIPGPRLVAEAAAVTLSAQVAVAPILVPTFGSIPVASIPANVVAGPIAGALMSWGMAAGPLAGVIGEPVAGWLHQPTRLLATGLDTVARTASSLPLGQLDGRALAVAIVAGVGALAVARATTSAPHRWARPAALAGLLVLARLAWPIPPAAWAEPLAPGARLWRAGSAAVLVLDGPRSEAVLDALRTRDVRRLDVVVSRRGSAADLDTLGLLRGRVPVSTVVAPEGGRVAGRHLPPGASVRAGGLLVEVTRSSPVEVKVSRPRSGTAAAG